MTTSLNELAGVFLKLGATAFGGPAAHIAMMEAEIVRKRGWLSREEFLDLLGAANLIPGPNSTELAIHIGHRQAGWAGLLVAGLCFILPAFCMVTALAWGYVAFGNLPRFGGVLYAIKPVVMAIVVQTLWNLSKTAFKGRLLMLLALVGMVMNCLGVSEIVILLGSGFVMVLIRWLSLRRRGEQTPLLTVLPFGSAGLQLAAHVPFGLGPLFGVFLKVGSLLFGSGYVLIAFLQGELVQERGWLTQQQLLDAVAVGQLTPGPVFTTATFIGYLLAGWAGAIVATVGIFLPAFVFVAMSGPLVPKLRQSAMAGPFLDGVNAAAVALMLVVTVRLSSAALVDPLTVMLALASLLLLLLTRMNPVLLIFAAAALGSIPKG